MGIYRYGYLKQRAEKKKKDSKVLVQTLEKSIMEPNISSCRPQESTFWHWM